VVLHPLECNQAIAGRLDLVIEDLEAVRFAQIVFGQLLLDQALGRLS
jgi:hypothetical protein